MFARLLELLFPPRADERIIRACSEDEFLSLLDPELIPIGGGMSAASLLPFTNDRVRAAVHEAKYRGSERGFTLLATALAEYMREMTNDGFGFKKYVLVPIPLGAARRKERGFNQVEEVLRRAVAILKSDASAAPEIDATLLSRTRDTVSQVSLPRTQRLRNMHGAFVANHPTDATCTYIICDDVLTTGATLSAACSALAAAGALDMLLVGFAH